MKIGIVGAGGLGACLAAQLAGARVDVTLVARGEHRAEIDAQGLEVRRGGVARRFHLPTVLRIEDLQGIDVLLVTVKTFSLDSLLESLVWAAQAGSLIVPLLNGVDAGDRLLAAGVAPASLVSGIAYLTGFRRAPGQVERVGEHGRIVLGTAEASPGEKMRGLANALSGSGLEVEISSKIEDELWRKMGVVCTLAAACVLLDGGMGKVRSHPYGPSLVHQAVAEVVEVAALRGVHLPNGAASEIASLVDGFESDFYPSVLHDLRSGRRTEVESLNGALARWARESGSVAAVHEAVAALIGSAPGA